MQTAKFYQDDTIIVEGEEGDKAYLILSGSVEVTIGEGTKAKRVGVLNVGDVFGEMALIEPGPRSATVRAISDTECAVTSYDEFMTSIQEHPERAVEFMKTLVRRLRQMNEIVASMDPGKRRLSDIFREWQEQQVSRRLHG